MSNFKVPVMEEMGGSFPWIPVIIIVASLVLVYLLVLWIAEYGRYVWMNRGNTEKKRKHKKPSKKRKDNDSDSDSSE